MSARQALLFGHFSTVGDIESLELVSNWLDGIGKRYDILPFAPSVQSAMPGTLAPDAIRPESYDVLVVICGPVWKAQFEKLGLDLARFAHCRRIGINLTMVEPIDVWNPYDLLLERDSDRLTRPDLTLLADTPTAAVVGRCLVKNQTSYEGRQRHGDAAALVDRLIAARDLAAIDIDTRWYREKNGLKSPAHVFSLLKRLDLLLTNRLHGMVYALKAGLPVVAIDAIEGGAKLTAQAQVLGWPACVPIEEATIERLEAAVDWCMTQEARAQAAACRKDALPALEEVKERFLAAVTRPAPVP